MSVIPPSPSIFSIFVQSWQIYRAHLVPILSLTLVLLLPAMGLSLADLMETESVVLFLMMRLLEAGVMLGILSILFAGIFPTGTILQQFLSRTALRPLHVGILQYLLFIFGMTGLVFPPPMNVILVAMWLGSIFVFAIAQPVCILEDLRGLQALVRSFQLTKSRLGRTFGTIVFTTLLQFALFVLLLQFFMPEINFGALLSAEGEIDQAISDTLGSDEFMTALRQAQYLTALLFYPYASIVTVLLYLDLSRNEPACREEHLRQQAQRYLAIPAEMVDDPDAQENVDRVTLQENKRAEDES
jgi:hypothetical protein